MSSLLKLDIACGQNKAEGYTGVDKVPLDGVDIVCDLEKYPWPFETGSVSDIHCAQYVEHTKDLIKFIEECNRLLVVGGTIKIIAPYYTSIRAWQDPTHVRAISEATWLYFVKSWREKNKLDHYGIQSDFDFAYQYNVSPEWANRSEDARNFAISHYFNIVSDLIVILTKREPS